MGEKTRWLYIVNFLILNSNFNLQFIVENKKKQNPKNPTSKYTQTYLKLNY